MGTLTSKLTSFANGTVKVLHHRATHIVMTIIVSACTSTFAFQYGLDFNWQYGLMFAIALLALTYHYAKKIPGFILDVMEFGVILGLIALTVFFGIGAWLSAGTSGDDAYTTALRAEITQLESELGSKSGLAGAAAMSEQVVNARKIDASKAPLQAKLDQANAKLQAKLSESSRYDIGKMAIFGHIQEFTGWSQKNVDLFFMWLVVMTLTCMEITMGAAIFNDRTKQTKPSRPDRRPDQDRTDWDFVDQTNGPDQTVEELIEKKTKKPVDLPENVLNLADQREKSVLFEERRPDQDQTALFTDQTADQTKTRRTGLDRDVADKIRNDIINEDAPVAAGKMATKHGTGKELVLAVYAELIDSGFLMKNASGRYQRTDKCRVAS